LTARAIPRTTFRGIPFYNLRLLREPSLVDRQAVPEERQGLEAFMARFRLQALDRSPEATVEPLARLRAFLGAPGQEPLFYAGGVHLGRGGLGGAQGLPEAAPQGRLAPRPGLRGRSLGRGALGIVYRAVRRKTGSHVAVFRAQLVKAARKVRVVGLRWNGAGLSPL